MGGWLGVKADLWFACIRDWLNELSGQKLNRLNIAFIDGWQNLVK
jgi:hypothetical protein